MSIRIELAPEVLDDFERIVAHLDLYQVPEPEARIDAILTAIDLLATSPLIGRPASDDKRELVIGRDSHGYVALYRYLAEIETVFVLAVRAQREVGYSRQDDA